MIQQISFCERVYSLSLDTKERKRMFGCEKMNEMGTEKEREREGEARRESKRYKKN